ncbi:alpha/beta fold hydrolase [Candidatus Woesearchaeota archaeon]|jgi:pimeloyl-ACP methyl ester carboxylesterase|nr:alpha/beta fold hydrolase [Candidatus Woesearchaeota archaeon]MBT6045042.1 alpha/beta fold hydrolase [Candidatus Woesearchaeota archaeon]
MGIKTIALTIVIILAIAFIFYNPQEEVGTVIKQKITLQTSDGTSLNADFYPENSNKGIILIHMYQQDRTSWDFLIPDLRSKEYSILTFDLRGHGENQIKEISQEDFNKMSSDVELALEYLNGQDIQEVSIIGASIGANIGLNYAVRDPKIHRVALLSPGIEYQGINTLDSIKRYNRPLLIMASEEDEYSWNSSNKLFSLSKSKIRFEPYKGNLHGIEILKQNQSSRELLLKWLGEN